ncbi:MAG: N-acetylneuraminate synthase family protein [Muribaculum sp.]|nr:N-acetylneuraminate synthase family protein [Muribaculum sp.]
MREFKIGTIQVGDPENILVIPEIGINHNGSLETAKEMVLSAHRAGAGLIKHQTHIVEDEMCREAKKIIPGNADVSIYDVMEQCALNEDEEWELKRYTEELGMVFLSTPFSRAAADRLERFGVAAYKIGSGEMNNYPLIEHVASFGKPMIVSTGMNDLKSVSKAVNIMEKAGVPYALMHTTNLYPTLPKQVRLGAMSQLMREFPDVPIGLSDHTTSNHACIAAIALGAMLVERHYTDVKTRKGPDIACSMDEQELRQLIQASQEVPMMLGGDKEAIPEEKVTSDFAFASVVAIRDIKAGEPFTKDNIWVKRPGTGEILAEEYDKVLGKRAAVDIAGDVMIKRDMIS